MQQKRLYYFRQIYIMENDRLPKLAMNGLWRRNRSRSKMRWVDIVKRDCAYKGATLQENSTEEVGGNP